MSQLSTSFIRSVKQIIAEAQNNAVRAVNQERVLMYWHIGRHIVEEEQQGKEKADYGTYLIKKLAEELEEDFGSGFSVRQLEICRQFYNTFPNTHALRAQLNWTQYKLLLRIEDEYNTMVEYALPQDNTQILASKYQLYLPKKEELEQEFKKIIDHE